MITTAQEYLANKWKLEDGNIPSSALLLPREESIFQINLNSRKIEAPSFLSVETDQRAETIYFMCDRYHNEIDLTNTSCVIYYKNAQGEYGMYPVPFYDITTFSYTNPYKRIDLKDPKDEASVLEEYKPDEYYYRASNGEYIKATDEFAKDVEYYKFSLDYAQFAPAHVERSNYQSKTYYVKLADGSYNLDQGPYDERQVYYALIDCPKILFPWTVGGRASIAEGNLEFVVQFYILDFSDPEDMKYLFKLNTLTGKTKILSTMTSTIELLEEELGEIDRAPDGLENVDYLAEPTWVEEMQHKINTIYYGMYPNPNEPQPDQPDGYGLFWIEA